MTSVRICVLGAGVAGLAVAIQIVEKYDTKYNVTVIADKFTHETTSHGAFGIWDPSDFLSGDKEDANKRRKWAKATLDHMLELAHAPHGGEAGTFIMDMYQLYMHHIPASTSYEHALHYRAMTAVELARYPRFKCGYVLRSAVTECQRYLPWLMKRLEMAGVIFSKRQVSSISELCDSYDVIFNCSGLGAAKLVGDDSMYPIKGQTIRVEAPWLKFGVMAADPEVSAYILPGADDVLLGGQWESGDWDVSICRQQQERIRRQCEMMEPSLKGAKVLREWAGLRPGRDAVRLEREEVTDAARTVTIVHNYGHAGSGITLHWGCAQEALALAALSTWPHPPPSSML